MGFNWYLGGLKQTKKEKRTHLRKWIDLGCCLCTAYQMSSQVAGAVIRLIGQWDVITKVTEGKSYRKLWTHREKVGLQEKGLIHQNFEAKRVALQSWDLGILGLQAGWKPYTSLFPWGAQQAGFWKENMVFHSLPSIWLLCTLVLYRQSDIFSKKSNNSKDYLQFLPSAPDTPKTLTGTRL